MADLSVFSRLKTKQDFDREAEAFELEKLAKQHARNGNLPAALQIADRLTQLRASQDPTAAQQIQDIQTAQKIVRVDPGIMLNNGVPMELPGYGDVVSGIEGAKAGAKQNAQNQSDLNYNPLIKTAEIKAENKTNAESNLPKAEAHAEQILNVLNDIEQAPGLSASVGMPNPLKGRIPWVGDIAGTPAADFTAKLEQLKGTQFLEAYQNLKGTGAISNVEGVKAEQAIARMQTSQSEVEFLRGLNSFKEIVAQALDRERAKAGQTGAPAGNSSVADKRKRLEELRNRKRSNNAAN